MKGRSRLRRTVSRYRDLNIVWMFIILVFGLSALAGPADAEVVYTPVGVTVSGSGSFKIDLNHDGVTDFILRSVSQFTICGDRGGLYGSTTIKPAITGNGVVVSHLDFAAVLPSGVPIDNSDSFYMSKAVVTQFLLCEGQHTQVAGYLGLEFQINGKTHYGWAQIKIYASFGTQTGSMSTTLVGFAYETIPGHTINTGQTSGAYNAQSARDLLDDWAGLVALGDRTENLERVVGYLGPRLILAQNPDITH
jgi:hypothetical protein